MTFIEFDSDHRRDGLAGAMMTSIYLERRIPALNQQRFYTIRVVKTRFGSWAMVREWGRIGQPGTVRETWFETETAASEAGAAVRQRKEKRGYRAVGGYQKHRQ
jgi:predicted DNA-binding WGR domain protein